MSTACLLPRRIPCFSSMSDARRAAHTCLHGAWRFQGCQTNTQPPSCFLKLWQMSPCGLCPRNHPAELASMCRSPGKVVAGQKCSGKLSTRWQGFWQGWICVTLQGMRCSYVGRKMGGNEHQGW